MNLGITQNLTETRHSGIRIRKKNRKRSAKKEKKKKPKEDQKEIQFKISGENRLQMQAKKGEYKKRIKQQYDLQRKKLVS